MFKINDLKERPFSHGERYTKGRLFLWQANESILTNFVLRDTEKPIREYRKHIFPLLAASGINVEGAKWSIRAGCNTCACSPGFILPNYNGIVSVVFEYIEAQPERAMTEREAYRLAVASSL